MKTNSSQLSFCLCINELLRMISKYNLKLGNKIIYLSFSSVFLYSFIASIIVS